MAGFLDNAAGAGIANGIKEGLITGMTIANQKQQQNMAMALNGLVKDEDGNIVASPQKQQAMEAEKLKNQSVIDSYNPNSSISQHGAKIRGLIASSADKKLSPDMFAGMPESEQAKYEGLLKPDISGNYGLLGKGSNPMALVREKGLGVQEHENAIKNVTENKNTQNLLSGYQSMQNALTEFKNNPSPQSFHTLQNVARMNAGSNNRSGVSERADQYATDLGIKKDEAMQMITGNMSDVNLSSPQMVEAIKRVMDGELSLKQKQAAQQIGKNKKAQEILYNNSESQKYKPAFDSAVEDQYSQFDLNPDGTPKSAPVVTPDQGIAAKVARLKELQAKAAGKK